MPHQDFLPSHKVSVEDELLIDKELGELIQKQAIHLVSEHDYNRGFVSNLFVIPKKGGGQRPVFNLCQLNQFIKYEHFIMEGIHMLRDLLKPNDFIAKIDLRDAHFTVPIWKGRPSKVPRVSLEGHSVGVRMLPIWNSKCPQGLYQDSITGDRPVKEARNSSNHLFGRFFTDGLYQRNSVISCHFDGHTSRDVRICGELQKSQLNPTQSTEFLGFHINSITLTISLPLDKVKGIRK